MVLLQTLPPPQVLAAASLGQGHGETNSCVAWDMDPAALVGSIAFAGLDCAVRQRRESVGHPVLWMSRSESPYPRGGREQDGRLSDATAARVSHFAMEPSAWTVPQ